MPVLWLVVILLVTAIANGCDVWRAMVSFFLRVTVIGTISREEGWKVWVLLLPPGARTWGASFWELYAGAYLPFWSFFNTDLWCSVLW